MIVFCQVLHLEPVLCELKYFDLIFSKLFLSSVFQGLGSGGITFGSTPRHLYIIIQAIDKSNYPLGQLPYWLLGTKTTTSLGQLIQ